MNESPADPNPRAGERIERREIVESSDASYERPPGPGERIERHEVVRRGPADDVPSGRATPMWIWILPLVLVVIALVWFIFTRGEPTSPLERATSVEIRSEEVAAPVIEVPTVRIPDPGPAPAERSAPVPEGAAAPAPAAEPAESPPSAPPPQ